MISPKLKMTSNIWWHTTQKAKPQFACLEGVSGWLGCSSVLHHKQGLQFLGKSWKVVSRKGTVVLPAHRLCLSKDHPQPTNIRLASQATGVRYCHTWVIEKSHLLSRRKSLGLNYHFLRKSRTSPSSLKNSDGERSLDILEYNSSVKSKNQVSDWLFEAFGWFNSSCTHIVLSAPALRLILRFKWHWGGPTEAL